MAGRPIAPAPLTSSPGAGRLRACARGGLPLDRVLLDLHSGNLFGTWRPLAMDTAGVAMLVLVGTGLTTWVKTGRRR